MSRESALFVSRRMGKGWVLDVGSATTACLIVNMREIWRLWEGVYDSVGRNVSLDVMVATDSAGTLLVA